jgi:hypothetical protein
MSYVNGEQTSHAWKNGKHITFGNKKMSIPLFDIPSRVTCPGSTALCRKYCYAQKTEQLFPNVILRRNKNLALTKKKEFVDTIITELKEVAFIPYVRIHGSGDFYNQAYLNKWFEIARRMPEKKFLAFTKVFKLDFSKKPDNFNLYYSVWNDTDTKKIKNPDINIAYTLIDFKWAVKQGMDKVFDLSKATKCSGHCDKCLVCFENKGNVYFPIH